MILAKYAHPNNGHDFQQVEINSHLKVKELYEVKSVVMGNFSTTVYLNGFDCGFNSVFFDFYENGEEVDIYMDARFNPYIKERCNA